MSETARNAGIQALQAGDPKTALQHLAQAVQQNSQDAQAYAYLGAAYGQLNMPQQALEAFGRASELAPLSAPIRFNLGMALEKCGKREAAVACYRQCLVLDADYEKSRQALARLGEMATAPTGGAPSQPGGATGVPPAYPPPAVPPAYPPPAGVQGSGTTSSPAPSHAAAPGLGDFAIPGSQSYTAAPPPQARPAASGPPPQYPGVGGPLGAAPPPPSSAPSPYGAPPPVGGPLGAAPPPPPSAPAPYGAPPPVSGPPGGMQPLGDWAPPPAPPSAPGGPPGGMQPMGDWAPPLSPPGGLASGQAAPPPPNPHLASGRGGAVVAAVDAPEKAMSKGEQSGHCYLAGMGMGVWWGLAGALFFFLRSMLVIPASQLGRMMPIVLTLCSMSIALGALIYGIIGLIGSNTEDAEAACGNFGLALGILCALGSAVAAGGFFLYLGVPSVVGSVWISRSLGRSLGIKINEWQSTIFVVAGPGGVEMTQYRRR